MWLGRKSVPATSKMQDPLESSASPSHIAGPETVHQREPQRMVGTIHDGYLGTFPLPPPVRFQRRGRPQHHLQAAPRGPVAAFTQKAMPGTFENQVNNTARPGGTRTGDQLEFLLALLDCHEDEDIDSWLTRLPQYPSGPADDKLSEANSARDKTFDE